MASRCNLCHSNLKEPVCPPCGHVYCASCLLEYVKHNSSEDGCWAFCPNSTCRSKFPLVTLEITCLPQKFHRYIFPSIRRVCLENSDAETSRKELEAYRKQIASLERENALLKNECEHYKQNSSAHALGEKKAKAEITSLTCELAKQKQKSQLEYLQVQLMYENLKRKYANLKGMFWESQSSPRKVKDPRISRREIMDENVPVSPGDNLRVKRKRLD